MITSVRGAHPMADAISRFTKLAIALGAIARALRGLKLPTPHALACAAVLMFAASFVRVPVQAAQPRPTKQCGDVGEPACSELPPLTSPWSYRIERNYGYPDLRPFSSDNSAIGALPPYFVSNQNGWCYMNYTNKVLDPNFNGGQPSLTNGVETETRWMATYMVRASKPNCNDTPYDWPDAHRLTRTREVSCPFGTTLVADSVYGARCAPAPPALPEPPDPLKVQGSSCRASKRSKTSNSGGADAGSGRTVAGNPCDVSNGNKYQAETDYVGSGSSPLRFVRSYNSFSGYYIGDLTVAAVSPGKLIYGPQPLGVGWTATYFQRLLTPMSVGTTANRFGIYAFRPDGRILRFALYQGVYVPDADVADSILIIPGGYEYRTADDTVEIYDELGRLLSIAERGQKPHTLDYGTSPPGYEYTNILPLSVTDGYGHTLTFTYEGFTPYATFGYTNTTNGMAARLKSITTPSGDIITYGYGYNAWGSISSVTFPDATTRSYVYSWTGWALRQVKDETNNTFAAWAYTADAHYVTKSWRGSADEATGLEKYEFTNSGTQSTVKDPLGTIRTYTQTTKQGVFRETGSSAPCPGCGSDKLRTYDANGNITQRTDFNNVVTNYVYDTERNLETSRTEAYGTPRARTITTTWNSVFRLPDLIAEPGRTTSFTYDANGNLLNRTVTDTATAQSRTWSYTYDVDGRILTEDGPRTDVSDVTTYSYYSCTSGYECGQIYTVTNALNQTTTFNTYNAHGQPTQVTSYNGVATTLSYDLRQRVTARCENGLLPACAGGEKTSIEYWPTGLIKKVIQPDSSFLLYTYDTAHRLTRIDDSAGNYIVYTLDNAGNHTQERTYDPSNSMKSLHYRAFNTLSQLWKEIGSANTAAVTTTFGYDAEGNQTSIAAPLSRNTASLYDELNRLKQITDPGSGATLLGYDANDNLSSVMDPRGNITSYLYNGLGDQTQLVSPDTGTATSTYDSGGNLATRTDARGKTGVFAYDALDRLTSITYPDQTLSFSYDAGTNGAGRLAGASDANHSLSWSYDVKGRVTQKSQTVGSITKAQSYAYTNNNLTSLITPSGQTIAYGYTAGHVTSITFNGSTTILNQVQYEPFGGIRQWNWGNGTASTTRSRNQDGLVTALSSAGTYTLSYDDAFRITGIADAADSTKSWTNGYDLLDRMNSATRTGQSIGYTYDANGNRLSQSGTATAAYSIASTSNRVTSITGTPARTYAYDAAGNVVGYGSLAFGYSDSGRLSSVSDGVVTTSYIYNAAGQRVMKSGGTSTTYFAYDESGHLVGEYDGAGVLIQEIIWLEDIPVASIRPDGIGGVGVFYIHTDHLNTPRKLTRPSDNAIVWRLDSDPFGVGTPDQDPDGNGLSVVFNLRFPGQYFDSETGTSYNYFRDYDTTTGRYIESDPVGLSGGINTFGYVGGNPLSWIDPYGLDAIYINYDYYPVNTGFGFHAPLGHAGVVSIDPATGKTRYYEFGRYTDKECGNVRRGPVPDLDIGTNGLPTKKSLDGLYKYLSKNYGKDSEVSATYFKDSDFQGTISYAERFMRKHDCYSLLGNNCKTFAKDAAKACKEGKRCQ